MEPVDEVVRLHASVDVRLFDAGGLVDLNGHTEGLGLLTLNGGRVTTGTGTLNLQSGVFSVAAANNARIDGRVNLAAGPALNQLVGSVGMLGMSKPITSLPATVFDAMIASRRLSTASMMDRTRKIDPFSVRCTWSLTRMSLALSPTRVRQPSTSQSASHAEMNSAPRGRSAVRMSAS